MSEGREIIGPSGFLENAYGQKATGADQINDLHFLLKTKRKLGYSS